MLTRASKSTLSDVGIPDNTHDEAFLDPSPDPYYKTRQKSQREALDDLKCYKRVAK